MLLRVFIVLPSGVISVLNNSKGANRNIVQSVRNINMTSNCFPINIQKFVSSAVLNNCKKTKNRKHYTYHIIM